MTHLPVADLKAGDVILPPAREMRLWMRRHLAESGLPESTLYITVTEVAPDSRRSGWLRVRGTQNDTHANRWNILAKPGTPWPVVRRANSEG